ncbi:hypothetical protein Tco_0153313 [Tanacetum coccineum]
MMKHKVYSSTIPRGNFLTSDYRCSDEKNASMDALRSKFCPQFIDEWPSSVGRVGQAKSCSIMAIIMIYVIDEDLWLSCCCIYRIVRRYMVFISAGGFSFNKTETWISKNGCNHGIDLQGLFGYGDLSIVESHIVDELVEDFSLILEYLDAQLGSS